MDIFESFIQHTSVRSFTQKEIPQTLKERLITVAQSGSSSNFVQAYSILEIRDAKKLAEIEKIANAPGYITNAGVFYIFVADLFKHQQLLENNGLTDEHLQKMEPFIVSIVDTTIAAQNMAAYAETQNLGICYIGGIRNDLFRIAELLELPPFTFPVFGMSIGYPAAKNEVKTRLPQEAIVSVDAYQPLTDKQLETYNEQTAAYYSQRTANKQTTNWQEKMLEFFKVARRPEVAQFMQQQGFKDFLG